MWCLPFFLMTKVSVCWRQCIGLKPVPNAKPYIPVLPEQQIVANANQHVTPVRIIIRVDVHRVFDVIVGVVRQCKYVTGITSRGFQTIA